MAQDDPLAASAALDELLGDLLGDTSPTNGAASAERRAARPGPEQDGAEKDAVQASPLSRSAEMRHLDEEMSREIAQLSKEMSACLASLSTWEEERHRRNSAYREAIEACQGPHGEELLLTGDDSLGCRPSSVDSPMGEDAQPEGGAWPDAGLAAGFGGASRAPRAPALGGHGEAVEDVRARALAALARADAAAAQADEERVRQLREEVELLRRAEEALEGTANSSPPWGTRTTLDDDDPEGLRDLRSTADMETALVAAAVAAGPAAEQPSVGLLEEELSELLGECYGGAAKDGAGG